MVKKIKNKPKLKVVKEDEKKEWQSLVAEQLDPVVAEKEGVVAAFSNNEYIVFVREHRTTHFSVSGGESVITHLMVVRRDKMQPNNWEDMQRIKNEICHPEAEGLELFPAESRKLDMTQTHIWVLEPGILLPVGTFKASVIKEDKRRKVDEMIAEAAKEKISSVLDETEEMEAKDALQKMRDELLKKNE